MPRDSQGGGPNAGANGAATAGAQTPNGPNGAPGGGLGNPIDTPDALSKYKYWILGGLALALAVAAAFLLRKPVGTAPAEPVEAASHEPIDGPVKAYVPGSIAAPQLTQAAPPALNSLSSKSQLLLEALKEELFAIESEKISGAISPEEYAQVKSALEIVLRRALTRG
jgi:hypothetical protein